MPFQHLENTETREMMPGFQGKFVHTDRVSLAFWEIKAGAELPEHAHPHEQIAVVMEGRFEITVIGETQVIEPGLVVVIPSNALHSGRALTDCRILDVFQPPRDDYR
jgi:quercetin dioxygenase-like cupin family protein